MNPMNFDKADLTPALINAGLDWQSPASDIEITLKRNLQTSRRGMTSSDAADLANRLTVRFIEPRRVGRRRR